MEVWCSTNNFDFWGTNFNCCCFSAVLFLNAACSNSTSFTDRLSRFDVQSTTSIFEEQIPTIVSLVESCFKTQLAPILDLILWFPTNAPHPSMLVSQGGDKVGSSKDGGEDKVKLVGKVFSTQI